MAFQIQERAMIAPPAPLSTRAVTGLATQGTAHIFERNLSMSEPQLTATVEAVVTFISRKHPQTVSRQINVGVVRFGGFWFCRFTELQGEPAREFESSVVSFRSRQAAFVAGAHAVMMNVRDQVEAIVEFSTDDQP